MNIAYFDCFAGAAGDMIVAALLDAGASIDDLRAQLAQLHLDEFAVRSEAVRRSGIGGTKFHVEIPPHDPAHVHGPGHAHDHDSPPAPDHAHGHPHEDPHEHPHAGERPHENHGHGHEHEHSHGTPAAKPIGHHHSHHRRLSDILQLIERANLPARAADRAASIFRRLAEAEAKVHRMGVEEVHFHEVGAVDSIVDIVGACLALELLGIDAVRCSPIPTGSGFVQCEHGLLPVPAPATAELLRGILLSQTPFDKEVTTPTGAAILTTLASDFGPLPPMQVKSVGYGAGTRQGGPLPNLLRVFIGRTDTDDSADTVVELSANIDDCTGEVLGATLEALLAGGCLDAWAAPICMKKSRPAWMLSALCMPADVEAAEKLLFTHTTTFGIRRGTCMRSKLQREHVTVETPYGPVRVKVGRRSGQVVTAAPEFADCNQAAQSHHVSVREVLQAAQEAYRTGRIQ